MRACVIRETLEETGLTVKNPVEVGYIEFPGADYHVHVFKSTEFSGELKAKADEVNLFWQDVDNVPYDKMRTADRDFLPLILTGKFVKRRYFYSADGEVERIEDIAD